MSTSSASWTPDETRYFIYKLHSRFPLVFTNEGLELISLKLQQMNPAFWKSALDSAGEERHYLATFLGRLIRLPQLLRSLDFRVFVNIDTESLQGRETFNKRTLNALEKINRII